MSNDKKQIIARLSLLFTGLDRAYGQYILDGKQRKGKNTGKAKTIQGKVNDYIWEQHLRGEAGLGIVPIRDDASVRFGAIDVDVYTLDLIALEKKIREANLPLILCRTKSGGAHLYLFGKEDLPAALVREKLMGWAGVLGYAGVEIFPKQTQLASQNDTGNWLNMPYFEAKHTTRYAIHNGKRAGLLAFLHHAETVAVTEEQLDALEVALPDNLEGAPPCLQILSQHGFPEGTRNDGLFNLGVYARNKYGDNWREHLDEFNRQYMDPPLPSAEVVVIGKALNKKQYFYTCTRPPINGYCNKDFCRAAEFGIGESPAGHSVALDGLTKITSQPPLWIATVDGVRIELSTSQLYDQTQFRKQCVECINKLPKRIKPNEYEKLLQYLLDNVEEIEAPEDAGPVGQFRHYLMDFLSRPSAKTKEELLMGKAWFDPESGRVHFRSPDLVQFLLQENFKLASNRIFSMLREVNGVKHGQFNLKGQCIQWWSITPLDLQNEPFDLPTEVSNDPLDF